jgi:hypothetical protein
MITYSLRHKPTGSFAAVRSIPGDRGWNSREYYLTLQPDEGGDPPFAVDTAEQAVRALALDTPTYQTTPETPAWDGLIMTEFEIVKLETTTIVTPVEVEMPVRFARPLESRKTAPIVAKGYLGRPVPSEWPGELRMNLVVLPEGETKESLVAKCEGKLIVVGSDATVFTHCVGVFETPEEYADLFNGKQSVGLITGGTLIS